MGRPIRWKYDICSTADRPEGDPKWRVVERPASASAVGLFKSDDVEECKRWIEEREYEGGYAKSRPRGPDGRIWTSPFQKLTYPVVQECKELPKLPWQTDTEKVRKGGD